MRKITANFHLVLGLILSLLLITLTTSASAPQSTVIRGQSVTLLADGGVLLLGGSGVNGPHTEAWLQLPETGEIKHLPSGLLHARAGHSATLLPDGTVLILGGISLNSQLVDTPEIFNPLTQTFIALDSSTLTPRAYHTATLLTDGRVLIAGGLSGDGKSLASTELWNLKTLARESVPARLETGRHAHSATLLADGDVLLWGGTDKKGQVLNNGELFNVEQQRFTTVTDAPPFTFSGTATLVASTPAEGALNVPVDAWIALRFSKSLRVATLNQNTVRLFGPVGIEPTRVVPAEGGRLAFITPKAELMPGETYTLIVEGPRDETGTALSFAGPTFTTQAAQSGRFDTEQQPELTVAQANNDAVAGSELASVAESLTDGADWIPKGRNFKGDWRMGHRDSPWQSLPPRQAANGITALAGQVLLLNGKPLAHVTLTLQGQTARTDRTGRFLLESVTAGSSVLTIDGRTANRGKKTYGLFEAGVEISAAQTTVLPYTIWMPKIDTKHAVTIPSPTKTKVIITTPHIPGLELHIPANTVIRDHDGKPVTELGITPIPVDRTPFPLPENSHVPIYFTIQPGGSSVQNLSSLDAIGARLVYPNYADDIPGTRIDFTHYDPDNLGWYVYGARSQCAP